MSGPQDIPTMIEALRKRGISEADFCKRAGVNPSTWGRWKRDEYIPTLRKWQQVQTAYKQALRAPTASRQHHPAA